MQRFPPRATTFILTIHLLYVSVADFLKVFPVTLYACVCVCVSWDLELQFLVFLVHVTGWTIFVFRTEPSRSHLPKQTGTLLLPPQSERGIETESAGSQKNTTTYHFYIGHKCVVFICTNVYWEHIQLHIENCKSQIGQSYRCTYLVL